MKLEDFFKVLIVDFKYNSYEEETKKDIISVGFIFIHSDLLAKTNHTYVSIIYQRTAGHNNLLTVTLKTQYLISI